MRELNTIKPLGDAAVEQLEALFEHGPTYDGNLISKSGRSELVEHGLVERLEGFNWLTRDGVQVAIDRGCDRRKM